MDEKTFRHELQKAQTYQSLESDSSKASYWKGYQRGLRRAYHGDNFGTADEHAFWLKLGSSTDRDRQALGDGYRDGCREKPYCSQNKGQCSTCSLVSYGRDCNNISLTV